MINFFQGAKIAAINIPLRSLRVALALVENVDDLIVNGFMLLALNGESWCIFSVGNEKKEDSSRFEMKFKLNFFLRFIRHGARERLSRSGKQNNAR